MKTNKLQNFKLLKIVQEINLSRITIHKTSCLTFSYIFSQLGYATSLCHEVTGSTVRDCSIMVAFTQILHWKIFKRKATINNHVYIMNYRNVARFIVICTSLLHCSSPCCAAIICIHALASASMASGYTWGRSTHNINIL